MRWFQARNFYDSWRPVYKVSRFFSLTTVTSNHIDRVSVRTSTDQTLFIVGILMCCLLAYNSYETYLAQTFSLTNSHLISGGMFAYLMFFELTVVSSLILNYVNGFHATRFFDIIHKVDQQFGIHFDYRWNYQKQHFQAVAYLVFSYLQQAIFIQILSLASPSAFLFDGWKLLRIVIAFGWVMGCYQTIASITTLQLTTISKRFAVLNKSMEGHLEAYLTEPDKVDNPRRKIRQFAMMHAMLSDTVRLFNDCFSKQITFALGCAFLFSLFAIFGLIHAYAAVTADLATYHVTRSNMLFSGFFHSFIFQLVVCTTRLNYECKRCSVILQKAVSYGRYNKAIFKECELLSLQFMHHAPKVSNGLFDFDWTLCYTIIGSLTTYLVILLQFDFVNFKMHVQGLKQGQDDRGDSEHD